MFEQSFQLFVLAASIYEDLTQLKNLKNTLEYLKENNKNGALSIELAINRIANRIYSQINNLTKQEKLLLANNFNQPEWELITNIYNNQKNLLTSECINL
jgi:hypothetical protein